MPLSSSEVTMVSELQPTCPRSTTVRGASAHDPKDRPVGEFPEFRRMDKVNLREKFALFEAHWSPKVVGELNGQHVKLVKFLGEFVWHKHEHEDELFLVVEGRFRMDFRDRQVWLEPGEFLIVPRGVEHRPVADEEVCVMLFEPVTTLNTGDVRDERTIHELERI
jgi:mannose-6-phosphate isomerase-like protein (cupin superfamily)